MRKKVLKTNLAVALIAEEPANNNAMIVAEDSPDLEKTVLCSVLLVQNVAKILWYHSNLLATDRYIAEIVSKEKELAVINTRLKQGYEKVASIEATFFDVAGKLEIDFELFPVLKCIL